MADIVTVLQIIRDNDIRSARQFARLMWPHSPCWGKMYNIGAYGATRGMGMWLAGGSFLGKLRAQGLIHGGYGGDRVVLTDKGKERLPGEI